MADNSWKDGILLKIVNVVVYFFFIGSNITAALDLDNYFSAPDTYITPAPFAFIIWPLTHFLLLGTIIYQFFPGGKRVIIDDIGWALPSVAILDAIYVRLWADHNYIGAFECTICMTFAVTRIYYVIKKDHSFQSVPNELFIQLPFSLYHGWIAVLFVLSGFQAFGVTAEDHPAKGWTKAFVFLALMSLQSTAATYAISTDGDLAGSIAITLTLYAIYEHQTSSGFIHWSAAIFAVLALLSVLQLGAWVLVAKIRGGNVQLEDPEQAPILAAP
ncbi:hypothetical protein C8J56DRAFT_1080261 [Mycena floridula]|nr:hypothetical protein C8J56DRAFT_1080261 [Mycena floridula]